MPEEAQTVMGELNPYLSLDQNMPKRPEAPRGWEADALNVPLMNPVIPEVPMHDETTRMVVPEQHDDIPMVEVTEEASLYDALARETVTNAVMNRQLDIDYLPIEGDNVDPIQKIMDNIDEQLAEMRNLMNETYGVKVGTIVEETTVVEPEVTSITATLEPTALIGELVEDEPLAPVIPLPRIHSDELFQQPQVEETADDFLESWYRTGENEVVVNDEQETTVIAMPEKVARREKQGRARKWLGRAAMIGVLTAGAMGSGFYPTADHNNERTANPTVAAFEAPVSVAPIKEVAPTTSPETNTDAAYDDVTLSEWGQANGLSLDVIRQAVEVAQANGQAITEKPLPNGNFYYEADDSANGGDKHETRTSKLVSIIKGAHTKVRSSSTTTQ